MPVPRPMEDSTPRPNHHTMNKAHSSAAATPPCDVPAPVQYPMKFEFSSAAQGVLWKRGKQLRTPLRNDQGCGVVLCCEVWDGWYPSHWRSCRLVNLFRTMKSMSQELSPLQGRVVIMSYSVTNEDSNPGRMQYTAHISTRERRTRLHTFQRPSEMRRPVLYHQQRVLHKVYGRPDYRACLCI